MATYYDPTGLSRGPAPQFDTRGINQSLSNISGTIDNYSNRLLKEEQLRQQAKTAQDTANYRAQTLGLQQDKFKADEDRLKLAAVEKANIQEAIKAGPQSGLQESLYNVLNDQYGVPQTQTFRDQQSLPVLDVLSPGVAKPGYSGVNVDAALQQAGNRTGITSPKEDIAAYSNRLIALGAKPSDVKTQTDMLLDQYAPAKGTAAINQKVAESRLKNQNKLVELLYKNSGGTGLGGTKSTKGGRSEFGISNKEYPALTEKWMKKVPETDRLFGIKWTGDIGGRDIPDMVNDFNKKYGDQLTPAILDEAMTYAYDPGNYANAAEIDSTEVQANVERLVDAAITRDSNGISDEALAKEFGKNQAQYEASVSGGGTKDKTNVELAEELLASFTNKEKPTTKSNKNFNAEETIITNTNDSTPSVDFEVAGTLTQEELGDLNATLGTKKQTLFDGTPVDTVLGGQFSTTVDGKPLPYGYTRLSNGKIYKVSDIGSNDQNTTVDVKEGNDSGVTATTNDDLLVELNKYLDSTKYIKPDTLKKLLYEKKILEEQKFTDNVNKVIPTDYNVNVGELIGKGGSAVAKGAVNLAQKAPTISDTIARSFGKPIIDAYGKISNNILGSLMSLQNSTDSEYINRNELKKIMSGVPKEMKADIDKEVTRLTRSNKGLTGSEILQKAISNIVGDKTHGANIVAPNVQ